jgi:hypothetical protein
MKNRRTIAAGVIAIVSLFVLGACSNKASQQFKDAPRSGDNSSAAQTGTMPDGFSNFATKCDHGNRVYVLFHNDAAYGSIAVVPSRPTTS